MRLRALLDSVDYPEYGDGKDHEQDLAHRLHEHAANPIRDDWMLP